MSLNIKLPLYRVGSLKRAVVRFLVHQIQHPIRTLRFQVEQRPCSASPMSQERYRHPMAFGVYRCRGSSSRWSHMLM